MYLGIHVSFVHRTVEPNGLLLNTLGRRGSDDFAAFELYDGILYFVVNVGDGVHHIRASENVMNDGQPHAVSTHQGHRCVYNHIKNLINIRTHFAHRRKFPGKFYFSCENNVHRTS